VVGLHVLAAGDVEVEAAEGGDATAGNAPGGRGGSIDSIRVERTPGTAVQYMAAGAGGDSVGGAGGPGGNIRRVSVTGIIGNDSGNFGLNGLGGLFAGAGGDGLTDGPAGDVIGVRARGIAAIAAGSPTVADPLAGTHVVSARRVAGIRADYVGMDIDADGNFDFINNAAPATYSIGDEPVDGYVHADSIGTIRNSRGLVVVPLATSSI
jgi:hypothetical protein